MTKNNIHCLAINDKNLKSALAGMLDHWEGKVQVETITDEPATIIKSLMKKNIHLFFVSLSEPQKLEQYKKLLSRYSLDTILVNNTSTHQPLKRDLSGVESCSMVQGDTQYNPVLMKNLLSYSQLKREFRHCKHLMSITNQRNRWLVNITPEPIAYLYKGIHIHANAAYLSLFGFQSMAELKSTGISDLVPAKSKRMFNQFMKKQQMHADMQQTLLMTMNAIDNSRVRAGIRIAPAVLNNTKCTQLWIHKIEDSLENKVARETDMTPISPWENLPEKKNTLSAPKNNKHRQSKQHQAKSNHPETNQVLVHSGTSAFSRSTFARLRKSVKSIKLKLQPLTDTHSSEINHYFVKLQIDAHEQLEINQKLKESSSINPALFWDRLLLLELAKQFIHNQQAQDQFLLSLTATSVSNNAFIAFLIQCLKLLPDNHPSLIFLIPHAIYMNNPEHIRKIHTKIHHMNCSLGLYNFVPDQNSLQRILKDKPAYISFSSKWMKNLSGKHEQLSKFTRLTDRLEDKGIEIILPPFDYAQRTTPP